jgi:hypothetical protein
MQCMGNKYLLIWSSSNLVRLYVFIFSIFEDFQNNLLQVLQRSFDSKASSPPCTHHLSRSTVYTTIPLFRLITPSVMTACALSVVRMTLTNAFNSRLNTSLTFDIPCAPRGTFRQFLPRWLSIIVKRRSSFFQLAILFDGLFAIVGSRCVCYIHFDTIHELISF